MALEELYSHYERPRTSILMGHARGVICLAAAQASIPVVNYRATHIKKTLTGNGRASKAQMQRAITRELRLADAARAARRGRCAGRRAVSLLHRSPSWAAIAAAAAA